MHWKVEYNTVKTSRFEKKVGGVHNPLSSYDGAAPIGLPSRLPPEPVLIDGAVTRQVVEAIVTGQRLPLRRWVLVGRVDTLEITTLSKQRKYTLEIPTANMARILNRQ